MLGLLDTASHIAFFVGAIFLGLILLSLQKEAILPIGMAGNRRKEALKKSPLLRLAMPLIQAVSVPISWLPLDTFRKKTNQTLIYAGQPAGISSDELLAVGVLLAVSLPMLFGLISSQVLGEVNPLVFLAGPIGLWLPVSRITDQVKQRVDMIERRLPYALDLIIVCAEAGAGLEDAVGRMVDASGEVDPLTEEFAHFRQEAEVIGLRRALRSLVNRVPSAELRRLIEAIMEGEDQGTPYREILIVSRNMIRTRQSTRIEKEAQRAAQLILFPTMLIFVAILVMLMGGMILQAMSDAPT